MSRAIDADYLFVGPLVLARLADQVTGTPVEGIEDMAQARDDADMRPRVLYVMWGGDRFDTTEAGRAANGASQKLYQRWIVWLKVRNASQARKDARNTEAGAVLMQVHKALAGWVPPGGLRPLVRTQGPAPDYKPASGLYPLSFEIQLAL